MCTERDNLLEEANELGIEFPSNIPSAKLQAMVDEAKGLPPAVDEVAPASPAAKPDPEEEKEAEPETAKETNKKVPMSAYMKKRQKVAAAKKTSV